jgi:uncharacterized iron-regulated membrane protein
VAWISARRRTGWLQLHRWLGLVLGPVFVLLGLSGSLLVFYTEIDAAITPVLAVPGPAPEIRSWQAVLDALERAQPQRDRGWRIELPPEGRGIVTARYLKPAETAGEFFAPLLVSVHPQTGQVLAERFWGRFAATWVYDLHFSLLVGEPGVQVVGVLGLLFTLALVAGLLLWWPRAGHWRSALRLRFGGPPQRRHYDWHKALGLGGAALLLVLSLTGIVLALPTWVEPLFHTVGGPAPSPRPVAPRLPGQPLLPLDAALARVQAHWPGAVPRWVDTPAAGSAVLRVRLWLPGDPSRRFPHSLLWLHAQTGAVLAARDARQLPAGDALLAWVHPLHNGEALGLAGRVLVCVTGLVPLGLALTGWLRWRDRRRARRLAVQGRRPIHSTPHPSHRGDRP